MANREWAQLPDAGGGLGRRQGFGTREGQQAGILSPGILPALWTSGLIHRSNEEGNDFCPSLPAAWEGRGQKQKDQEMRGSVSWCPRPPTRPGRGWGLGLGLPVPSPGLGPVLGRGEPPCEYMSGWWGLWAPPELSGSWAQGRGGQWQGGGQGGSWLGCGPNPAEEWHRWVEPWTQRAVSAHRAHLFWLV